MPGPLNHCTRPEIQPTPPKWCEPLQSDLNPLHHTRNSHLFIIWSRFPLGKESYFWMTYINLGGGNFLWTPCHCFIWLAVFLLYFNWGKTLYNDTHNLKHIKNLNDVYTHVATYLDRDTKHFHPPECAFVPCPNEYIPTPKVPTLLTPFSISWVCLLLDSIKERPYNKHTSTPLTILSLRLVHAVVHGTNLVFSSWCGIFLRIGMPFIHSTMDGHLNWFQFGAIMKTIAVNFLTCFMDIRTRFYQVYTWQRESNGIEKEYVWT